MAETNDTLNVKHILLKKSDSGNPPAADILEQGEIGISYKKDKEAIYVKNSNNEITPIINKGDVTKLNSFINSISGSVGVTQGTTSFSHSKIGNTYVSGLSASNTIKNDIECVANKFGAINSSKSVSDVIIDNEEVTATALNTMANSVGLDEYFEYKPSGKQLITKDSSTLAEAIEILDKKLDAATKKQNNIFYRYMTTSQASVVEAEGTNLESERFYPRLEIPSFFNIIDWSNVCKTRTGLTITAIGILDYTMSTLMLLNSSSNNKTISFKTGLLPLNFTINANNFIILKFYSINGQILVAKEEDFTKVCGDSPSFSMPNFTGATLGPSLHL